MKLESMRELYMASQRHVHSAKAWSKQCHSRFRGFEETAPIKKADEESSTSADFNGSAGDSSGNDEGSAAQ